MHVQNHTKLFCLINNNEVLCKTMGVLDDVY